MSQVAISLIPKIIKEGNFVNVQVNLYGNGGHITLDAIKYLYRQPLQ